MPIFMVNINVKFECKRGCFRRTSVHWVAPATKRRAELCCDTFSASHFFSWLSWFSASWLSNGSVCWQTQIISLSAVVADALGDWRGRRGGERWKRFRSFLFIYLFICFDANDPVKCSVCFRFPASHFRSRSFFSTLLLKVKKQLW